MTKGTATIPNASQDADGPDKGLSLLTLTLLALGLGILTGFGALVFRVLINLVHNVFFNGTPSVDYNADAFTEPSRWGIFIIFAPVLGGIVVTWLVSNFAPEAKGHGVPEVMDAIYY
jgi:chloride channel protein, CIC family